MDAILHPAVLYVGLAVGALGVVLALPRPRVNPQLIGTVLAAAGFGAVIAALAIRAADAGQLPNIHFYIFAGIAILSALRVITHQRPVYSALYFILTILSSSAIYLLLGAEFMAFALVIIYAGAILITYLFVIMLATQAPEEGDVGALSPYDAYAREPIVATAAGFLLLAVLTGMLAAGAPNLQPEGSARERMALLADMPGKLTEELERRGLGDALELQEREAIAAQLRENPMQVTLIAADAGELRERAEGDERVWEFFGPTPELAQQRLAAVGNNEPVVLVIPASIAPTNLDGVGWELIAGHPMALELAGVILLMAMLGAVVLARKQIEIGEEEKARAALDAGHASVPGHDPGPSDTPDDAATDAQGSSGGGRA